MEEGLLALEGGAGLEPAYVKTLAISKVDGKLTLKISKAGFTMIVR